ncbi:MAG: hypothetical protein FJ118_00205 [Deltaproteobacteria bacterium]|nr:hypothetical protein [Deltaproteobacteria bacterium]
MSPRHRPAKDRKGPRRKPRASRRKARPPRPRAAGTSRMRISSRRSFHGSCQRQPWSELGTA